MLKHAEMYSENQNGQSIYFQKIVDKFCEKG